MHNRMEAGIKLKNDPNHVPTTEAVYRQTTYTSHTKYQNLNVSRFVLHLFLVNPLKEGVKFRMKI